MLRTVPTTCLICLQRAGLGPPADLLSGVPESRQRARPLLPTSLRLRLRATCAVKFLGLCGKTHFELCSPFKHVAAEVMTMQLHSAVQLPAPRTCHRRREHKGRYRVRDRLQRFCSTSDLNPPVLIDGPFSSIWLYLSHTVWSCG